MPWLDLSEDILWEFTERAALFVDTDAIASGFHDAGTGTVTAKKSEYNKDWKARNKNSVKASKLEWREANRDRERAYAREYAKNNREKILAKKARYRERLKARKAAGEQVPLNGKQKKQLDQERVNGKVAA